MAAGGMGTDASGDPTRRGIDPVIEPGASGLDLAFPGGSARLAGFPVSKAAGERP